MSQKSTLLEKGQSYKSFAQITLIVFNISLSSFYFGYCAIYFSAVPYDTISKIYGIDIDPAFAQGLLNGANSIGGLLGSLLSSVLIKNFSRRKCILVPNFCSIIFGGLIFIPNFYTFLTFRFCQGICVGIFSSLSPLIIKEISPLQISGIMGNFSQFSITGGVIFCQVLTYVLKKVTGDTTAQQFWYIIFGFSLITQVIQALMLVFVFPYETPSYLLKEHKIEQCRQLLSILYKQEFIDDILQQKRIDLLHNQSIMSSQEGTVTISNRLAFIVSIFLTTLQQFSGAYAMVLYGAQIAERQFTGQIVLLFPVLINVILFVFNCVCFIILKNFGRKTIIVAGFITCGLTCGLAGLGFTLEGQQGSSIMILTGICVFMVGYGSSLGPVVWLYIPEVVSPGSVTIITTFNWISNTIVATAFPLATQALNGDPAILFFAFSACCITGVLINSIFMVETKDKTDKEIRYDYQNLKIC